METVELLWDAGLWNKRQPLAAFDCAVSSSSFLEFIISYYAPDGLLGFRLFRVYAYSGEFLRPGVSGSGGCLPPLPPTLFGETVFHWTRFLGSWGCLALRLHPGWASLHPWCWDYTWALPHPTFYVGAGIRIQVFTLLSEPSIGAWVALFLASGTDLTRVAMAWRTNSGTQKNWVLAVWALCWRNRSTWPLSTLAV